MKRNSSIAKRRNVRRNSMIAVMVCMVLFMVISGARAEAATTGFSTEHGNPLCFFEYYHNASGTWKDYETARHYETSTGAVAYCLQHKYWPPESVVSYSSGNGTEYYSASVLNGLQILMQYGYPAGTGGLSADGARYATQLAIWMWLAENGDSSEWYQDTLANGQIRPKSGAENQAVWDFTMTLLNLARAQKQMEHTVTVSADTAEMKSAGENFVGTFTVTLSGCSSFKVAESSLRAVEALGGTIAPTTGSSGTKVTITIPKSGNAGKTVTLSVQGMDRRMPDNCLISQPANTDFQRMIYVIEMDKAAAVGRADIKAPLEGKIAIYKKTGAIEGTSLEERPEAGAVFEIRLKSTGELAATLTTDQDGKAVSDLLPLGTYTIHQTKGATGFELAADQEIKIETASEKPIEIRLVDKAQPKEVTIVKIDAETGDKAQGEAVLEAVFRVIAAESIEGTPWQEGAVVADSVKAGEVVRLLPGTYRIEEISCGQGYELNEEPLTITVSGAEEKQTFSFENHVIKRPVSIQKLLGSLWGEGEQPEAGAEFEIIENSSEKVVCTLMTDSEGRAESDPLPYGSYTLRQTKGTEGYRLAEPVTFSIEESSAEPITFTMVNEPFAGTVAIEKTGLMFIGAEETAVDYGTLYTPVFEERPLGGVEFEIHAAETITVGGVVKAEKDQTVGVLTTSEEGLAESGSLYPGNYYLKEVAAPEGIVIAQEPISFTIESDGETSMIYLTLEVSNDFATTQLSLTKLAEVLRPLEENASGLITLLSETQPGAGFVFGLFADEVLQGCEGEIPEGALVCVGETDETGRLLMEARLPMGRYYLMELGGPCEYELSDVQYEVEISGETINESGKIVIEVSDAPIVNYLVTYPVTITKSDLTDGTPLAGAIIEIHNEQGETIYRGVTDENGEMDEIELTPGTYTFTEISAPAGYEKSEETITFTLSEDGEITGETEMKDKRIPEEPEKPGNPDVPNTGDSSVDMLTVLGIVLLVAAGGMLIVIEVKKRVRRER